ncbi:MAG: aminotransferase class I/II-fold pyridoxal phosphate-dependent enzyme [Ignavibacteria bacterium]|nr:aminotransferase class I/II-fold pyridoxal phosphate-dependent enzyme [Ignavibacteria bacterium]
MGISEKASNLIGSEILQLGSLISQLSAKGQSILNLTIGDFNPSIFPIPELLKQYIIEAYIANETNYPPADGVPSLKFAVRKFLALNEGLDVANDEILIAAGGRPLIYAAYKSILDPGDVVVYPTPSWNNNHYCYLTEAIGVEIPTSAENGFMPTADELRLHVESAAMFALCSPGNPTGTTFTREQLEKICDIVIEENKRREGKRKPLYVLYDQIYWMLRTNGIEHVDPVSVRPEMKNYTVYIDGISKAFAATGVRVGWSIGPPAVINVMKKFLVHVGAWAPRAEQIATARFLNDVGSVNSYIKVLQSKIDARFNALYNGLDDLRSRGFPVHAIKPQGAIYVSAQFDLIGKTVNGAKELQTTADITNYLIHNAGIAAVPFTAFGCPQGISWFRISVGTLEEEHIQRLLSTLESVLV